MARIIVENVNISNLPQAVKGMRNPLESWGKSDSAVIYGVKNADDKIEIKTTPLRDFNQPLNAGVIDFILGEDDRALALRLIRGGAPHGKFLRQIGFIADITAPMTWWWDFDTYKVATTKNSTSRMHKLGSRMLTYGDFGWDEAGEETESFRAATISRLNERILAWRSAKKNPDASAGELRKFWRAIIDDLPQSYMFKSTWSGNYQTLREVYFWRKGHKQAEFDEFRKFIETLPCSELITEPFQKPEQ
ncbi:MAG: hypothetical protein LBR83_00300 [Clostridiales bacterium]|jgi:hypothetical protein|nr:hypothetical protein [Clostridiales bacterium]